MKSKRKILSEQEIDGLVIAEADHDSAWGKPVKVEKPKSTSLVIPSVLAAKAAFFARLHREKNLEQWLKRIIQERIDMEDAAFTHVKRELVTKTNR